MRKEVVLVKADNTTEIIEIELPDIEETEELSVWDELDAAYREGVNSI